MIGIKTFLPLDRPMMVDVVGYGPGDRRRVILAMAITEPGEIVVMTIPPTGGHAAFDPITDVDFPPVVAPVATKEITARLDG